MMFVKLVEILQRVEGCYVALRGSGLVASLESLGNCSCYVAELWGAYEEIKLAKGKGFTRLKVELDSTMMVKHINSNGIGGYEGWKLLKNIKELIQDT